MTTRPLYSGLETSGMLQIGCSLRLQPDARHEPLVKRLPPGRVTVTVDGSPNRRVDFQGCAILQLNPVGSTKNIMPPILTICWTLFLHQTR